MGGALLCCLCAVYFDNKEYMNLSDNEEEEEDDKRI